MQLAPLRRTRTACGLNGATADHSASGKAQRAEHRNPVVLEAETSMHQQVLQLCSHDAASIGDVRISSWIVLLRRPASAPLHWKVLSSLLSSVRQRRPSKLRKALMPLSAVLLCILQKCFPTKHKSAELCRAAPQPTISISCVPWHGFRKTVGFSTETTVEASMGLSQRPGIPFLKQPQFVD